MPIIRLATPQELAVAIEIDDDACELYASIGIHLDFPREHPFAVAERLRWRRCAEAASLWVAVEDDTIAGFAALEHLDRTAHLEQLSVRRRFARRGVGTALLKAALEQTPLTLTTYAHVPWNAPWYTRMGFRRLEALSPELQARMDDERANLPMPERRVAMRHD